MENSNRNDMNNSEDTRRDYESPATNLTRVKMEGYLCGSANITNPEEDYGIQEQQTNTNFDITGGVDGTNTDGSGKWDLDGWNNQ